MEDEIFLITGLIGICFCRFTICYKDSRQYYPYMFKSFMNSYDSRVNFGQVLNLGIYLFNQCDIMGKTSCRGYLLLKESELKIPPKMSLSIEALDH